jgi:hypothetical protein
LIKAVLIAPEKKLRALAAQSNIDISAATVIDVPHSATLPPIWRRKWQLIKN